MVWQFSGQKTCIRYDGELPAYYTYAAADSPHHLGIIDQSELKITDDIVNHVGLGLEFTSGDKTLPDSDAGQREALPFTCPGVYE